jgi:hypothetical protein
MWLKPQLVAQIEFTEWTPDGHLRHSKFVGLREDKVLGSSAGALKKPGVKDPFTSSARSLIMTAKVGDGRAYLTSMKGMQIPALGKLITDSWTNAEEALREIVKNKFPDRNEDIITELFHAELEHEFNRVSENGDVAKAFLSDLKGTFRWDWDKHTLFSSIAQGLIATVSFHSPRVEGQTGGDLGIVVIRPDVKRVHFYDRELTVDRDYKRGLLCQAKIFGRNSRWGKLGRNQEKILPAKLSYFGLLLYRYSDQDGERRSLEPFAWQLAHKATVKQIKGWLASGLFEELRDSEQVLQDLIHDRIGTDNKALIDNDIAPRLRRSLVIEIRWKDGEGPGKTISVQQRSTVQRKQQAVIRRG